MNGLAFDTPWVLAGLFLLCVPFWRGGMQTTTYPWLAMLPVDPLSKVLTLLIKLLGALAIAALVLGLAGLHRKQQHLERIGHGAHIVLLLDRSNSMDNTFAGKVPNAQAGGGRDESKADAARRLLTDFVDHRPHDRIGIAEYSTSPLFVMPMTENREAIHAAIAATAAPALAYTNVSKGLMMALSFFEQQPVQGSRIVLLVSDGAAAIDPDSEAALRAQFKQQDVRLYWLFLRTANTPGIFETPTDPQDDNAQAMPELYLHRFFSSLNIPYQAYEAENPDAMRNAVADIDRLERLPLHYWETLPKQDLSATCYGWALALMALLLALKFCEARTA